MNEKIKAKRDEIRDPSLHFRPECEGFRCGAHRSWNEGFDAGYAEAMEQAKTLVDALEFCAAQVTWVDYKNQDVILTYGHHVEKARNALEQFKKDTGK